MRRSIRILAAILTLVMVMGLVACGGTKTPTTSGGTSAGTSTTTPSGGSTTPSGGSTTTEPAKPAEPKILVTTQTSAAANASVLISQGASDIAINQYTVATLYMVLPDGNGGAGLMPALAESKPVDVNGDGKTWNIKINKDAKFENGEKIDADVMLFSFKSALDPKLVLGKASPVATNYVTIVNANEYYTQASTGVAVAWEDVGFKKVDDMTIQVTLTAAANETLVMRQFSARQTAPIYQPLWEKCLSADGTTTTYGSTVDTWIGSGPFTLTNWVVGNVREFVKNENFIRADLVKVDGVKQLVVEDSNTKLQLFEKGEIDYIELGTDAMEKYGDDPRIENYPSRYVYTIEFCTTNTEELILRNDNFRLALYYGTDRAAIAKLTGSLPGPGLINWRSAAYADGTKYRTIADAAGYIPANDGYDAAKAKAYFEKALQEAGMSSVELTFLVNSGSAILMTCTEYLQESWNKLFDGKLTVVIDGQPSAQVSTQRKSFKTNPNAYEITWGSWNLTAGDWDPLAALKVYTTTYSSRNSSYAEYPELTDMYNEGNNKYLLDPEKRVEIAMDMEKYILDRAIAVPVIYDTNYCLLADRIVIPVDQWDSDLGWGWMYVDIAQ